ncbi:hypothetical protein [Vibrio salinus]|uniref:hypothetical protein n=1 Tax=Vibrio salinus TaxID=2899784 RepID=UPI001E42D2AD|nr:hypothetical protein [Vibrio salinus]MCE0495780.1 hypothetical protein [Vibrio salinus]
MRFAFASYQKHRLRVLPVLRRTDEKNKHNFADEVDMALLDDRAFLFLCDGGFIVLQPIVKDGSSWVNIMFAYSWGTTALPCYMNDIFHLAGDIGAVGVELYTVVKKLERFLIRKGFSKDSGNNRIQHWVKRF